MPISEGAHFHGSVLCCVLYTHVVHTSSVRAEQTCAPVGATCPGSPSRPLGRRSSPERLSLCFSLRTSRQASESQSPRTAADQDRVGRGDHPGARQCQHPDVGRRAAGGAAAHHVLQRQDGKVSPAPRRRPRPLPDAPPPRWTPCPRPGRPFPARSGEASCP